ncbi:MAG TPA: DUF4281 domain-containing protein, partial [Acidobacteria bacterium]|nr:DUF4281 domain-containing protein [Acidobacteriota bacterium]
WAVLVFVPGWRWGSGFIAAVLLPAVLGGLYLTLMGLNLIGADGGFGSLAEVARLFENPSLLLAGWVHYLAFDLFIGAWEVRDARRLGIPHLLVVPCLVLTFMLGPVGLLLYLGLRVGLRRRWMMQAGSSSASAGTVDS